MELRVAASAVVDLGDTPVRPEEIEFLRAFFIEGLGEFSFRNRLDLRDLIVSGGVSGALAGQTARTDRHTEGRSLIPFGGGLDSVVTVELVRGTMSDSALFILSPANDRFDAIESAVAAGRPRVRSGAPRRR